MASLICNGDLAPDAGGPRIPLYARPVLRPSPQGNVERAPGDTLFVDLVHRALRRIVIGDGDEPPAAPQVRIINLSIGDESRAFSRELSPLARLLDWLSWEHKLVFVVSAGNHIGNLVIDVREQDVEACEDGSLIEAVFSAIAAEQSQRRILSPGESVNALTVGASHEDAVDGNGGPRDLDVLRGHPYPSPVTRIGLGYMRSVKPDLLMPGGRQTYRKSVVSPPGRCGLEPVTSRFAPGLRAACPGMAGETTAVAQVRGTSVSTALTTRLAAQVFQLVRDLTREHDAFDDGVINCITKALVVHAARWRDPLGLWDGAEDQHWTRRRSGIAALAGFGVVDPELALLATEKRVVLIGGGYLSKDQAHRYEIPMPEDLGNVDWRRQFVTTLAWITPVSMGSRKYRKAKLSISSSIASDWFDSTTQANESLAGRGTVAHLHRLSQKRIVVPEDGALDVQVNCSEDAGKLSEAVPYGVAITLEVAEPIEVDIHSAVRARLGVPIRPRA